MIDNLQPIEYLLDQIRFTHLGKYYSGRGLLTWDLEKGFHIQAFLDQPVPKNNPPASFGDVVKVEMTKDAPKIRMFGRGFGHAIVPEVFSSDMQTFLHEGRLSIRPQRVIFFQRLPTSDEEYKSWSGSAIFVTKTDLLFPDTLETKTTLNGQTVEGQTRGALCYEDVDGFSVWGRKTGENHFTLTWALPKSAASRTDAWRWAEAARRALSILFAQMVWPVRIAVRRGRMAITELRCREQVHSLKFYLHPLRDFEPLNQRKFNRTTFIRLTRFFTTNNPHTEICWSIFRRLAEASRQETWESKELLTATTLEAALRTLDNHPFKPGDRSWKINQSVESFCQNHLDANWNKTCENALHVQKRLRHRNAHPDWITHTGNSFSKQEWRESIEDTAFLSRFYGYMILALAGFKNLQPKFPVITFE